MAGRKPLPIEMHRLTGTYRKSRHGATKGAFADGTVPICPQGVSEGARAAWEAVVPLLAARGVLGGSDGLGLQLLCESISDWRRLRAEVATEGETYVTVNAQGGKMYRPNPKVAIRDQAEKAMRASMADFGLNPSARAKLHVSEPAKDANPFADLDRSKSQSE